MTDQKLKDDETFQEIVDALLDDKTTAQQKAADEHSDRVIAELLSKNTGDAIIAAANSHFMQFAPLTTGGEIAHTRLDQAGKVVYEYVVGGPSKFLDFWRSSFLGISFNPKGLAGGAIVVFVLTAFVGLLALPYALLGFLHALGTSWKGAVMTRELTFYQKTEVARRLKGE